MIAPLGQQHPTGPGPFGIIVSASGKTAVTSNGGPDRYSLTVMERDRKGPWEIRHIVAPKASPGESSAENDSDEWRSVFMGLAFASEKSVYASEGNSGRVRLIDLTSGGRKRVYDHNQGGFADSYTGDLAFDTRRGMLYVVDQANFRLVAIDTKKNALVSSVRLGRLPFAVALAADGKRAYVTNIGMFEYKPVPGAEPKRARETGLPFPAFGFPSPESEQGANRQTGAGGGGYLQKCAAGKGRQRP